MKTKTAAILYGAFLLSGMCALAYQVVWTRMLALTFGSTNHAIATVLAVFMLGLCLGSFVGGNLSKRTNGLGRIYGLLETALGIYALVFLFILPIVGDLHSSLYLKLSENTLLLSSIHFFLGCLLLLLPTMLMGATLPIVSQYIVAADSQYGEYIGFLYAVNTLGAALGTFASAFVTIPNLGLHSTLYLSASVNILIGVVCMMQLKDEPAQTHFHDTPTDYAGCAPQEEMGSEISIPPNISAPILFTMLFMTGCIGMLLENSWSHALVLVFGTSVYAFATMLTTYLVGLALGSYLASRFLLRFVSEKFFWGIFALGGLSIFISTQVIGQLPGWFVAIFGDMKAQWHEVMLKEFMVCFGVMIFPALVSGAVFPLSIHALSRTKEERAGTITSAAYIWNTLGSICGALLAGFVLVPVLGSERCLLIAGGMSLALGSWIVIRTVRLGRSRLVVAGLALLLAVSGPLYWQTWNAAIMNSGVYVYSRFFTSEGSLAREMKKYELVYYKEGSAAVAVLQAENGHRFLRVNGKTDGSSFGDNTTQMLLAYLPYLYAPTMDTALVIGLGTGITSGCMLDVPVRMLETVEISPEVVSAASYFATLNANVFSDPRSKVLVQDGRTWLSAQTKQYDVIVSEPSNPWQTGNANLFTVDFFKIVADKIKPSGIYCQWLPYYNMDSSHFRLILKSLQSVFPHINIWMSGTDTFVISSKEPLVIQKENITQLYRSGSSVGKLTDMGIKDHASLLGFFYLDKAAVQKFIHGVEGFNTDANPVVEFHSPKFLLGPNKPDIFFSILESSYESPLTSVYNSTISEAERAAKRRPFYRAWRIPSQVTENMVLKTSRN